MTLSEIAQKVADALAGARLGLGRLESWRELTPVIHGIYARSPVGCCWHVVLDDGNTDPGSVQFCYGYAVGRECEGCILAGSFFMRASRTQLAKAIARKRHPDEGRCGIDGCDWCDRG